PRRLRPEALRPPHAGLRPLPLRAPLLLRLRRLHQALRRGLLRAPARLLPLLDRLHRPDRPLRPPRDRGRSLLGRPRRRALRRDLLPERGLLRHRPRRLALPRPGPRLALPAPLPPL